MVIEHRHDLFKSYELDYSVGDLSSPEGSKTFVESLDAFISFKLIESNNCVSGEGTRFAGLDSNF